MFLSNFVEFYERILFSFNNLWFSLIFPYKMLYIDIFIILEIWFNFQFQVSIYLKEYQFYFGGIYMYLFQQKYFHFI